jgi:DNA-binding response OmpR family regulator
MVVEDEPDLYATLLALFGAWSIDGVAFTNGTDAVKWIDDVDAGTADTNIPELAILDIRLPGVESPVLKEIAIVLVTAFHLSPQQEKEAIAKAQADDLIYKPLPAPPEFRAVLQKAIARRRATPSPLTGAPPPANAQKSEPEPGKGEKPTPQGADHAPHDTP